MLNSVLEFLGNVWTSIVIIAFFSTLIVLVCIAGTASWIWKRVRQAVGPKNGASQGSAR